MRSLISRELLDAYFVPGEEWDHAATLGPFFAVHGATRVRLAKRGRPSGSHIPWAWTDRAAVEECLAVSWHMTGRWKARRAATVRRAAFDRCVLRVVPALARRLNRSDVSCLRDLAQLDSARYGRLAGAVVAGVQEISSLRRTRDVEPILGSKVLHHFFPSVVPVYDRRFVLHGIMQTAGFRQFLAEEERTPDWLVLDEHVAGGPTMLGYASYLAYCTAHIRTCPAGRLRSVRRMFGRAFADLAPGAMGRDPDGLLWMLDAKIAEYCLLGTAHHEGLL